MTSLASLFAMAALLLTPAAAELSKDDVKKVLDFERGLHQHLKSSHAALMAKLEKDKAMDNMHKIDHVSKAIKECKLAKQMDVERHKSFTEQMKNLRLVSFNEQKWSDRYK